MIPRTYIYIYFYFFVFFYFCIFVFLEFNFLIQLEPLPQYRSDVIRHGQLSQQGEDLSQLHIVRVVEPATYREGVVVLQREGLGGVIYDDDPAEVPSEDLEVLDVVALDERATFSKEPLFGPPKFWVDNIEQLIRVHFLGRCENDYFEELGNLAHELLQIWPLHRRNKVRPTVPIHGERDGGLRGTLGSAVDKGLV